MNIDVYWQDEDLYTLRIDIIGDWTWDRLETRLIDAQKMVTQLAEIKAADEERIQVDYILDLRHAGSMPKHSLNRARRLAENQLKNTGIIAIISKNTHTNVVFNTAQRLSLAANRYFYMASTFDDALTLIEQYRTNRTKRTESA